MKLRKCNPLSKLKKKCLASQQLCLFLKIKFIVYIVDIVYNIVYTLKYKKFPMIKLWTMFWL